MKMSSTEAPIQASTCLKSKEKLQVRIDSSSSPGKDLEKSLSLKPLRSPMKKNSGAGIHHTVNLSRETCSAAMKLPRVPDSLELDEPKMKLCTYSYCSLHNQKQEATLPVVKCFLRTKRHSFEAQNRMNHKKKSSRSKNDQNKTEKIEEASPAEVEIADIAGGINGMMLEDRDKSNQLQESYSVTSFEDYDDDKNSEISADEIEVFTNAKQQGEHLDRGEAEPEPYPKNSPKKLDDFFGQTEINSLSTADSNIFPESEEEECQEFSQIGSLHSQLNITRKSDSDGDISDELACEEEKVTNFTSLVSENPLAELTNMPKLKHTMRRMPAENQENSREFKPRMPRFLPLKTEAEAEKVNLKHQPMEERKTAEEWMIDYALRRTLGRMAPARKRKVSLLVAAFESVIQQERELS